MIDEASLKEVRAVWKIQFLGANDDPQWQNIYFFGVIVYSFPIQIIKSPEIVYSTLILREKDIRTDKMPFESSFTGKNFAYFQKKTSISRDMGSAAEGQDSRAPNKCWILEYLLNMQNPQKL